MAGRIGGTVVALIVLAVGFMYASQSKSDEGLDMHSIILEELETLPDYGSHGSLYNKWLDYHHEASFDANYTIERQGGRRGRTVTSFDSEGYLDDLFSAMISEARGEGYEEQAENLRHLREELYIIEVDE